MQSTVEMVKISGGRAAIDGKKTRRNLEKDIAQSRAAGTNSTQNRGGSKASGSIMVTRW
jgi:hypothetical protein